MISFGTQPLSGRGIFDKILLVLDGGKSLFGTVCNYCCSLFARAQSATSAHITDFIGYFEISVFGKILASINTYYPTATKLSLVRVGHAPSSGVTGLELKAMWSNDLTCVGEVLS